MYLTCRENCLYEQPLLRKFVEVRLCIKRKLRTHADENPICSATARLIKICLVFLKIKNISK
jgi:hypothetical protein